MANGWAPAQGLGDPAAAAPYNFWTPLQGIATAANFATLAVRNAHRVLAFDPDTDEACVFHGVMDKSYAGEDITVKLYWTDDDPSSGSEGTVRWDVSWERGDVGGVDLDADSFAAVQSATGTGPLQGSTGEIITTSITFTQAQADGIAGSESFRLKVVRDANHGSDDTLAVDAQLWRVAYEV